MLRLTILMGSLILCNPNTAVAQTGLSVYGALDTISHQPQSCSYALEEGTYTYRVDGEVTDSLTYQKCLDNYNLMSECKPCWSKAYDNEGRLLYEAAAYTDCLVGEYRAYHPSGELHFTGYYRSDVLQDSTGKMRPGSCNIKSGDWIYYNKDGTIDYEEIWRDGRFLQQIPNQEKSEIWAINLTFFGGRFDPQKDILRFDMVNKLTIQPLYKNANRTAEVTGIIKISGNGHPVEKMEFTPTSFPYLPLNELVPEGDDWKHEDLWVDLEFYVDGTAFIWYRLKVY